MKILMLTQDYPPIIGGGGRYVQSLSRELASRGSEVIVCTPWAQGLLRYEQGKGIAIHRLQGFSQRIPFLYKDSTRRFHPPVRDWVITNRLRRIVEKERPDMMHAYGWMLYSALPLKKDFRTPIVVNLQDYGFLCPKMSLLKDKGALCDETFTRKCIACGREFYGLTKSLAAYYGVKTNKKKLKLVDKFIAVSSFVKQAHVKHLGLNVNDVVVIPHFYDPEIEETGEEVAFPDDFVLFVGALSPHKGVDVLLEAYRKLKTQAKLVLIGHTHPDHHYRSTENVFIIENAAHNVVMQAMSRCRFAVFPSIWPDPFPIVTIEAMSQGKAVIASAVGGLIDGVVDGETGILVPPNDSDKLAEAIACLLKRPELSLRMGASGYQRFIENYTPDAVMPRILDLYHSLMRN
jgi:glycosyltransferase involved in cell wall biosynthesis